MIFPLILFNLTTRINKSTIMDWFDCLSLAWLLRDAALTMFSIVDLIVVFRYCPIWVSSDIDMPVHSLPRGIHRLHQVVSQHQRVLQDRAGPDQGPGADLPSWRGLHLPPPVRDPEARPAPSGGEWGEQEVLWSVHLSGDGEQAALQDRAGRGQADYSRSVGTMIMMIVMIMMIMIMIIIHFRAASVPPRADWTAGWVPARLPTKRLLSDLARLSPAQHCLEHQRPGGETDSGSRLQTNSLKTPFKNLPLQVRHFSSETVNLNNSGLALSRSRLMVKLTSADIPSRLEVKCSATTGQLYSDSVTGQAVFTRASPDPVLGEPLM